MKRYSASPWTPFVAGAVSALATRLITDSVVVSLLVAVVVGLAIAGIVAALGRRGAREDA
ncbi:hypothetical protein OHA21_13270 [Actinoplanes sp. NBC_00393]|uniref:hypothetical protein n=1 Tax=Actinoplanes sp. NBC_00393 TaxID=2975953 RepID=UPI002E1B9B47